VNRIRIALPAHLRTLARSGEEVQVEVEGSATVDSLLDALESAYPVLAGTIRDHGTGKRRAYLRYFADGRDISHEPTNIPLPDAILSGSDAFCVVGAIAGG
jgi:sulfur-carrier protein